MTIEDKIFNRYSPDFKKLKDYGFKKVNNSFTIESLFKDDLFKAVIRSSFRCYGQRISS